jgi:hypothetical protein
MKKPKKGIYTEGSYFSEKSHAFNKQHGFLIPVNQALIKSEKAFINFIKN